MQLRTSTTLAGKGKVAHESAKCTGATASVDEQENVKTNDVAASSNPVFQAVGDISDDAIDALIDL